MSKKTYMHRETLEFARRLLAGDTQCEAYRVSHPDSKMAEGSMKARACKMASSKQVIQYLAIMEEKVNRALASELAITKAEAVEVLADIAFGKVSTHLDKRGNIKSSTLGDADSSLQEVSRRTTEVSSETKIKVRDPVQAIAQLSELLGWKKDLGPSQAVTFHLHMDGEKKEPSPVPDQ